MAALYIEQVTKRFGQTVALDSVSLSIPSGELFFLLGPSGCGKTTLLRILAGFTAPDSGTIRCNDTDLIATPIEKRNIGMVFQNYSLWPHMSVLDNVAYGLKMRGVARDQRELQAREALDMVAMKGLEMRKPGELSGGQQQRVALARALVYKADILLLDEPLSNLDAKLRRELRREITRIHHDLGITMMYVTHDQEEASTMADRIALMRAGKVIQTGTPGEVYDQPVSAYTARFFGMASTLECTVVTSGESEITLATVGSGTQLRCLHKGKSFSPGDLVTAAIRPTDFELPAPSCTDNCLCGTVSARELGGSTETVTVTTPDGDIQAVALQHGGNTPFAAVGQPLCLHAPAARISVLPREEAA